MWNLFDVLVHNDGWTVAIGNFKDAENLLFEAARLNATFLLQKLLLPPPQWRGLI